MLGFTWAFGLSLACAAGPSPDVLPGIVPPVTPAPPGPPGARGERLSAHIEREGCVVIAAVRRPPRTLFSRWCLGGSGWVEQRGVSNGESERWFERDVTAMLDIDCEFEPGALCQTLAGRPPEEQLEILARKPSARNLIALLMDRALDGESLKPWFGQPLTEITREDVPVLWSRSGKRLAVSVWPYGDFVPTKGYALHESLVVDTDTLEILLPPGPRAIRFEGESLWVTVAAERAAPPRSAEELLHPPPLEPSREITRGVYERWEGLLTLEPSLLLEKAPIGPFHVDGPCGELGPPGVPARFGSCSP